MKSSRLLLGRLPLKSNAMVIWNGTTAPVTLASVIFCNFSAVNAGTGIQWLCEPCQVPVAESSRILSESSAAILDSSEFNPTRGHSFNVSLLISFLSFRFPVHLFKWKNFGLNWNTLPIFLSFSWFNCALFVFKDCSTDDEVSLPNPQTQSARDPRRPKWK